MSYSSFVKTFVLLISIILSSLLQAKTAEVNVMGELYLETEAELQDFQSRLKIMKDAGVTAISVDVWWSAVEKHRGIYDFRKYDRVFDLIIDAGLKIVPILSTHRLGGNVGDTKNLEIPSYIWDLVPKNEFGISPLEYQSEQLLTKSELLKRNFSPEAQIHRSTREVISPWAMNEVLPYLEGFYKQFFGRYRHKLLGHINELNLSLGPAGELRHPSYNSHDKNAGYPNRGSLQIYSERAITGLQSFAKARYGSISKFNEKSGFQLSSFSELLPPHPDQLKSNHFYQINEHQSEYGKLIFDYNQHVLLEMGKKNLSLLANTMESMAPEWVKESVPIGAKIPGIHWRTATDRLAELPSGLISSSATNYPKLDGTAYKPILKMFKTVSESHHNIEFLLHFTALEFFDQEEIRSSLAKSLSHRFVEQAKEMGLKVAGENALGFKVHSEEAMKNLAEALDKGYQKLTLLRISEFDKESDSTKYLKNLIQCKYAFKK